MTTIRVKVTQAHIDAAVASHSTDPYVSIAARCPVARALSEHFGEPYTVGYDSAGPVGKKTLWLGRKARSITSTNSDDWDRLKPCTITVTEATE